MIILRAATLADLALLQYWDTQAQVIEADPNDDWGWETELARSPHWREQLLAELNSRPIGFIQIIDPALEDSHYWGYLAAGYRALDIWIGETADLGKGHGTRMMQLALQRCFSVPAVRAVLVDPLSSNLRAQRFYERLDFEFLERRRFGEDDCRVFQLLRENFNAGGKIGAE